MCQRGILNLRRRLERCDQKPDDRGDRHDRERKHHREHQRFLGMLNQRPDRHDPMSAVCVGRVKPRVGRRPGIGSIGARVGGAVLRGITICSCIRRRWVAGEHAGSAFGHRRCSGVRRAAPEAAIRPRDAPAHQTGRAIGVGIVTYVAALSLPLIGATGGKDGSESAKGAEGKNDKAGSHGWQVYSNFFCLGRDSLVGACSKPR